MRTIVVGALATLEAAAALASLALAGAPGAARPTCALADGDFHVALVINHADNTGHTHCVAFNPATPTFDGGTRSISGEEVLTLSQVGYQAVDFGGSLGRAVCQVDGEPSAPAGGFSTRNCLGNPYWVLWRASSSGGWTSAGSGITNQRFADGDAEGLSFGGSPSRDPHSLCPAAQPWPPPPTTAPTTGGPQVAPGSIPGSAGSAPGRAAAAPAGTSSLEAGPSPVATPRTTANTPGHGPRGHGPRSLSSASRPGLGPAVAAAFVGVEDAWSAWGGAIVAGVAVLALTSLLLTRVWMMGRNR
jgi:hypothetical protein